ncbi:hypothetical protein [Dokdonella sp.]|uniref:hypothetical protein n=1 Tax=Dokdonella sp. TaxID=2291710 RepID=UPI0026300C5A|nr:hypothetical protein [Dokdonella sp.]
MRKILPILFVAAAATFTLSACNKNEQKPAEAAAEQKPDTVPLPTDPSDKTAWRKYLSTVVTNNMQGVKSTRPYMYFVPAGDDEAAQNDRANQLDNVKTTVARGVLPGNMMAFGGPDSAKTSALVVDAFKDAQPGSFKDVVVMFVGSAADGETVKQGLAASGADVRIVEAK